MKNVIVDLDGTLANRDHRLHHVTGSKKDFKAFMAACGDDTPVEPIKYLVMRLLGEEHRIVVVTGRSMAVLGTTLDWLLDHDIDVDVILMRREGDNRPDHVVKKEMAEEAELTPENTVVVFDDRDSVVKMWRDAGFHVHQVAEGNF